MHLTLLLALVGGPAWAQDAPPPESDDASADESADAVPSVDDASGAEAPADDPSGDDLPTEPAPEMAQSGAAEAPPPAAEAPEDEEPEPAKKKRKKKKMKVPDTPEFTWDIGGTVQYDLRIRVPGSWPDPSRYYNNLPQLGTLSRNELFAKIRGGVRYGKVGARAELDFVLRAYPKTDTLSDLSLYNQVTPFRFEAHDLYLFYNDAFGARGLDLRIGQQKIAFGVGDQFNPTNNVNPLDLEDVLLFGDQLGNLMLRMDYAPVWNVQLTGVLVPIFKPALLPRTGPLAQTPDRYPYVNDQVRWGFNVEQAIAGQGFEDEDAQLFLVDNYPTIVSNVNIEQPAFNAENMQGFFRVGGVFGSQELALSYYRGRFDLPQPIRTEAGQSRDIICENDADVGRAPADRVGECVDGVLTNDVTLGYPRMHVLGLNWAGEAVIGYRLEVGIYFPEGQTRNPVNQTDIRFTNPIDSDGIQVNGPYDFSKGGPDGDVVVSNTPFAKWTLGLDYTFGKHVYLNAMWVHGFPDEFGAGDFIGGGKQQVRASGLREGAKFFDCVTINDLGNPIDRTIDGTMCAKEYLKPSLNDYVILGLDINFAAQRGLLRLFTIWDVIGVYEETWDEDANQRVRIHHHMFTKEGFSAVLYPDFRWKFGNGLELHAGALINLGQVWSKFGAPEVGGHQVWTRARYSF